MGDEGTEGNVSSRTLQRINKISREGLNIRFLLIREVEGAHKFGEEMAVQIFWFAHTEATDRSSSTVDTRRKARLENECKTRKANFRYFQNFTPIHVTWKQQVSLGYLSLRQPPHIFSVFCPLPRPDRQDSSFSRGTKLQAGRCGVRTPAHATDVFVLQDDQIGSGANPSFYQMGSGYSLSECKAVGVRC